MNTEDLNQGPSEADLVIVGGGPAGHSTAVAYRQAGGTGRVVIVSADDTLPYDRPSLSKSFLRGESGEEDLAIEPAGFYQDQRIEVWLQDPVTLLDVGERTISTRSGRRLSFGKCLLASGSRPAALPVPGGAHPDVLVLRSLAQARLLREGAARAERAVVIGSGFIGCEAAASLAMNGIDTAMVARDELPQIGRLGRAAAERSSRWLTDLGVEIHAASEVAEVGDGHRVVTTDGTVLRADLILSATGITPNVEVAMTAGLRIENDRVSVNSAMSTGTHGIWAAGDVAFPWNETAGRRLGVEHWGEALRMGEIAGINAAGGDARWSEVPGFWSTIGEHQVKYMAWGDGFDRADLIDHPNGGFTVWYSDHGVTVGALTYEADADYERAADLISEGAAPPLLRSAQ